MPPGWYTRPGWCPLPYRGRDWRPARIYRPWVPHPQTRCLAAATVPVLSGKAEWAAVAATTEPVITRWGERGSGWRRRSQQGLPGGIQQDRLFDHRTFAQGGQTQRGQGEFVDFAQNAFGGLIERLGSGVVKQRLGDA